MSVKCHQAVLEKIQVLSDAFVYPELSSDGLRISHSEYYSANACLQTPQCMAMSQLECFEMFVGDPYLPCINLLRLSIIPSSISDTQ